MECSILPTQGIRLHNYYVCAAVKHYCRCKWINGRCKMQSVIYSDVITYMAAIGNSGHVHPVHTN